MIVRGSSRPENRPNETVTQRLERLRLEHRRHIRNIDNTPSQPLTQTLAAPGPSLPDIDDPILTNAVDNWNEDRVVNAVRPRPGHPIVNVGMNAAGEQQTTPVNGPAPPRSWTHPTNRANRPLTARTNPGGPSPRPHPRPTAPKRRPKKATSDMTVTERLRLEEEELLGQLYGDEYWFRPGGDPRWAAWREEALRLVFSYTVSSLDTGGKLVKGSPFVPFGRLEEMSNIPTLFETILKLIFTPSTDQNGHKGPEYEDFDSLELLEVLPPHIRKPALRYIAVHKPLTNEQLRSIHLIDDDRSPSVEISDTMGLLSITEVVLSGRKVEADIISQLVARSRQQESTEMKEEKRQLLSFPKTITTLGLLALPPPRGFPMPKYADSLAKSAESQTALRCSCSWCTNLAPPAHSRTNSSQTRPLSSPPPAASSISAIPYTSSILVPQLVALPTLLPSLVVLDVSYNPWMSSDAVLRLGSSDGKEFNRRSTEERTEQVGQGILGTWDLRLWGRLKVLGVRGCHPVGGFDGKGDGVHPTRSNVIAPLMVPENKGVVGSSLSCACGVPPDGYSQRRRGALLQKWEKTTYAVGREVEVVWREHECRCGSGQAPVPNRLDL